MIRIEGPCRLVVPFLTAALSTAVGGAQVLSSTRLFPTTTQSPAAFGTNDYTITTISAASFTGGSFNISGSLGRSGVLNVDQHFYATLDIPAGVVIDYIGLNNLNDGNPLVIGTQIVLRNEHGGTPLLVAGISNSAHTSWLTDRNSVPVGYTYRGHFLNGDHWLLIVDVEIVADTNPLFFGWVEVWWRRIVSDPPGLASFTDVPTTHPFYKFVEALHAAGITAGYGNGKFGVDDPITRGQMAVFLSVALGLHWPD